MKKIWVIGFALVLALGCGDDAEPTNNGTNNGANNGTNNGTANNEEFGSKWEFSVDGEDPVKGTLVTTSGTASLLMIQLAVPTGASGTIQLSIDGIASGETGVFRDMVTTQILGLPGADNCGATPGGSEGAPTEIEIEINEEKHLKGKFTITEMVCNDMSTMSATGSFEKKTR